MSGAVLSLLGTSGGGASAVTITVNSAYIFGFNPGSTADAQYQLSSGGGAYEIVNSGAATLLYDWCVPASEAANYEVYATVVTGSLSGGSAATDTWLALSSTRTWLVSTGGVTIPANSAAAFPIGATVVIFNNSGSSQSIAITTDTLRQAGTTNTGTRTLANYGLATCVKVAATTWVITGAGLT